jgi:predicted MPP superfamily phosphohydrolase
MGPVMQAVIFLGVVLTSLSLLHYYLWRRLVRNTTVRRRSRRIGTWTVVGLLVLVLSAFVGSRFLGGVAATVLAWVGYVWLAIMFYLVVVLLVLEVPAFVARRMLRERNTAEVAQPELVGATVGARTPAHHADQPPDSGPPDNPNRNLPGDPDDARAEGPADAAHPLADQPEKVTRRLVLARAVAVTAGLVSVGLVGPGIGVAMGPPRLRRATITLPRLPRTADGLRVALVSDIHLGPLRGIAHTRRIVDMINSQQPDVIAMVGDLVDGTVAELGPAAGPLAELRSRYGTFFVTGNHEYFSGFEPWYDEIGRLGLRILRNERVELAPGVDFAGVTDVTGAGYGDAPDMARALAGRDPGRAVVVLAHQPIQAADAARHGADLQLSGHTHGGQMVPFNLVVQVAQQPVVSGLGEVDGMPVFVTNGAGFWGPPVRVGAPPDISFLTLRAP